MACRVIWFVVLVGLSAVAGCASWQNRHEIKLPASNTVELDQLVVHSNSPLPAKHRLLDELNNLRGAVNDKLGLPPSDEKIHVYLFSEAGQLRTYVQRNYPGFPERRAMFIESDTKLEVYAFWGDRVAEDLRHEVAHGYLHSVVPRIPLWLDEGLAEYYEVPRGSRGLNEGHVRQIIESFKSGWEPNMVRLENLESAAKMDQRDYAEAWAWAHWLLETSPERLALVRGYLADVRSIGPAESLSSRLTKLEPDPNRKFNEHVTALSKALGMKPAEVAK
jgi:Protein of unknown function (DUF1570)